jgi:hypothetical protein
MDVDTILYFIEEAFARLLLSGPRIFLGDLNADLRRLRDNDLARRIAATLVTVLGLDDLLYHFQQKRCHKRMTT